MKDREERAEETKRLWPECGHGLSHVHGDLEIIEPIDHSCNNFHQGIWKKEDTGKLYVEKYEYEICWNNYVVQSQLY